MISRILISLLMSLFVIACTHSAKNLDADAKLRAPTGQAPRLQDSPFFEYEVLFTNPVCGPYIYKEPQKSFSGKTLLQKPENVFCKSMIDTKKSGERPSSPQYRLIEWIKDEKVSEIFMTYLSYRNKKVKDALCEAIKNRGLKFTLVMSSTESDSVPQELHNCVIAENGGSVKILKRGHEGGIGHAHNKITIINPQKIYEGSEELVKIVFSSGNMTSGPVLHHENWHFITLSANTHFAQVHKCVMEAEIDEIAGRSAAEYSKYISNCRKNLVNRGLPEEADIKSFFVPGEGESLNSDGVKKALDYMIYGDGINPGIRKAKEIRIGAHRFYYTKMINALKKRMSTNDKPILKIVADDDTFYKGYVEGFSSGDTNPEEWYKMKELQDLGAELKFMETNHADRLLHHSKFLIFDKAAVLAGSANLTGAGFRTNWENIYYITIPSVVESFVNQYDNMLWKMATSPMDLPENPNLSEMVVIPEQQTQNKKDKKIRTPANSDLVIQQNNVITEQIKSVNAICGEVAFANEKKSSFALRADCNLDGTVSESEQNKIPLLLNADQIKYITASLAGESLDEGHNPEKIFACLYNTDIDFGTMCGPKPVEPVAGDISTSIIENIYKDVFKKSYEKGN